MPILDFLPRELDPTVDQDKTQLRVAMLMQGNEEYGVGQVALILATQLARRGVSPMVFALAPGALTERCRAERIPCRVLDLPPLPPFDRNKFKTLMLVARQHFWLKQASARLAKCLGEFSADSLIVQWPAHVNLAGKSAQLAGIPCHWIMPNVIRNSWPLELNRRYYRWICRRRSVTPLPNSRFTGQSLGSVNGMKVLYLGVDETQFRPDLPNSISRAELGLPDGATVAGIFARLDPLKGQLPAWQAITRLIAEGHDLHLLLVGGPTEGPYAQQVRDCTTDPAIASRLHFAGWTNEPERFAGAIDFAINATTIPEGFGLSVVEAMLMGRPVLAHALGGPAEIVVDGETGWHVSESTADAFTTGLRRVLADRDKWPTMGAAARKRALENFSASAFASNYLRILQNGE